MAENTTKTQKKKTEFVSKYKNHTLIIDPTIMVEKGGIVMPQKGKKIKFVDYRYSTDKKEEIDFIKNHEMYGIDFFIEK